MHMQQDGRLRMRFNTVNGRVSCRYALTRSFIPLLPRRLKTPRQTCTMGFLAVLAMQLWDMSHGTRVEQETWLQDYDQKLDYEWDADGEESDELEDSEVGHGRSRHKRRKMHRAGKAIRKKDITVWGSYREFAPPVLPTNASAPGFENEVLRLRRKSRRFPCTRRRGRRAGEHDWGRADRR